jgi:hypothetical protein
MSPEDVLAWVVALGAGAILAEVVRSGFQRRKMGADAAKVITDAATALLGPLQSRVLELETVVAETRRELMAARQQVAMLTAELEAARGEIRP